MKSGPNDMISVLIQSASDLNGFGISLVGQAVHYLYVDLFLGSYVYSKTRFPDFSALI